MTHIPCAIVFVCWRCAKEFSGALFVLDLPRSRKPTDISLTTSGPSIFHIFLSFWVWLPCIDSHEGCSRQYSLAIHYNPPSPPPPADHWSTQVNSGGSFPLSSLSHPSLTWVVYPSTCCACVMHVCQTVVKLPKLKPEKGRVA